METCFNYCYFGKNDGVAYFSSDEKVWINRIRKLKEQRPDEIHIIKQPEENDGCIYCRLPSKWLKVQPTKILTEEQKDVLRERIAKVRKNQ